MGPSQHRQIPGQHQAPCARGSSPRQRLCLLRGCEKLFVPLKRPERYCGGACRAAARRWQLWHTRHTYRRSEKGRERRLEQSRRRRERARERAKTGEASLRVDSSGAWLEITRRPDGDGAGDKYESQPNSVGHQSEKKSADCPCSRPGCYELFAIDSRSPRKKFCSSSCRHALRRVLQREARWLWRRFSSVGYGPPIRAPRPSS